MNEQEQQELDALREEVVLWRSIGRDIVLLAVGPSMDKEKTKSRSFRAISKQAWRLLNEHNAHDSE